MKTRKSLSLFLILFVVLIAACSGRSQNLDFDGLMAGLQNSGSSVEVQDEVIQPFFQPAGQVIAVDGHALQVFEFEDAEAADNAAATISPDGGSIGTSMASWIETPHFFKSGRLIVLYLGENGDVLSLLQSLLGNQVAGG